MIADMAFLESPGLKGCFASKALHCPIWGEQEAVPLYLRCPSRLVFPITVSKGKQRKIKRTRNRARWLPSVARKKHFLDALLF